MTTYVIDYSDPLKTGFSIVPGGFNGPGGSAANTTLRLYGRGALEWGEAVDEDLVRLTENFNSPTPPPYPVAGQLWLQTKEYWLQTLNWYVMDPDTPGTWVLLTTIAAGAVVTGGVVGTNSPPAIPVIGSYWYTGGAPVGNDAFGNPLLPLELYRYDSAFKQVPNGWMLSLHTGPSAAIPVNGVDYPERSLLVWDDFQGSFIAPPISIVLSTAPTSASEGTLWWDPTTNTLSVWDGTAWDPIALTTGVSPFLRRDGSNSPSANISWGSFKITNLANATLGTDALNLNTGDLRYINVAGDTMTGTLTLVASGAYPQVDSDLAATITYVNAAIATVGSPGSGGFSSLTSAVNNTTSVAHKPGDIYVDTATPRIYIAVTTATSAPTNTTDWKQVFPAQYS